MPLARACRQLTIVPFPCLQGPSVPPCSHPSCLMVSLPGTASDSEGACMPCWEHAWCVGVGARVFGHCTAKMTVFFHASALERCASIPYGHALLEPQTLNFIFKRQTDVQVLVVHVWGTCLGWTQPAGMVATDDAPSPTLPPGATPLCPASVCSSPPGPPSASSSSGSTAPPPSLT